MREVRAESKFMLWPILFLGSLLCLETFVVVFVLIINFGALNTLLARDPSYPMPYAGFLYVITTVGWVGCLQMFVPAIKWCMPGSICIWTSGSTFRFSARTGSFEIRAENIVSMTYDYGRGLLRAHYNDRGWGRGSEFTRWNGFPWF